MQPRPWACQTQYRGLFLYPKDVVEAPGGVVVSVGSDAPQMVLVK